MMLQELFDRWIEIQKQRGGSQSAGGEQERVAEELNILEALRLLNCNAIPGEPSHVQGLISDRHHRLENILRKRGG